MRVLFVSSGNRGEINSIIKNQGDSLIREGIEVEYFLIRGKGALGYLGNILKIRKAYKSQSFDLIHAHYSLSAMAASMAGRFPLIVSLMGSDVYASWFWRRLIILFNWLLWDRVIVKTEGMKNIMRLHDAIIIPNGVNIDKFNMISMESARRAINFPGDRRLILFLADPAREEKNYNLAQEAIRIVNNNKVILLPVFNQPHDKIPYYINAADLLLVTSRWEGSINVVKEAIACNCPVVSTNVGDTKWVLDKCENCYVTSFNPVEIAERINDILKNGKRTNGRKRIIDLKLDLENSAKRIIQLYKEVLK